MKPGGETLHLRGPHSYWRPGTHPALAHERAGTSMIMRIAPSIIPASRLAFGVLALLLASAAAGKQRPAAVPELRAATLQASPVVDGDVLGDAAWRGLEAATNFRQTRPEDGSAASQRTEVFVGFTDTTVYVGVVAYDDDPGGIVVTDSRRDSSLDDTDAFLMIIDGLLDRQNGFVFGTNPAGIEFDGQVTGDGLGNDINFEGGTLNLNWDGVWHVATITGDFGWSAEFEIPFRTLRFGTADEQDWGINFQRSIRRNNEVSYWAPLDPSRNLYRVSEAGTLRGVRPPPQRGLQFTPYVLGSARRGGELDATDTDADAGFDIKYLITPSLTLDLTLNTDFAQVEADDVQLKLDRFNLFFPEKRPFFLENAGQFEVGNPGAVEIFFSRRIGIGEDGGIIPVDGGARLSGKLGGSTNVGLLLMSTDAVTDAAPQNLYSVARINRELAGRSAIGAMFVGRNGDGSHLVPGADDHNYTYAIDGRRGIGDNVLLSGWLAKTETPGSDGKEHAFGFDVEHSNARWASSLRYTEVREDFNPEVGFLSRTEYRMGRVFLLRRIRPENLWGLLEIRPHVSYTGHWKFDGFQESGFLHLDTHFEYQTGTELRTAVNFTRAGVIDAFEIVDDVVIQPGTYDHSELQLVYFTDESRPVSVGVNLIAGGRFGGDRISLNPYLNMRVGEIFRSEFSIDYNDFDLPVPGGDFTASLARLRLSYSFTPKVTLQALIQYNDLDETLGTNIRFSWLRSANAGLYLVYNEVDERGFGGLPTGRELIVKYSYIFDILN